MTALEPDPARRDRADGRRLRRLTRVPLSSARRLAGRAPVRRPLAAGRPASAYRDRRAAAPARRAVAAVDPHPLALAQVAGGGSGSARSLLTSSICVRPATSRAAGRAPRRRGVRGSTPGVKQSSARVHVADAGQVALVEQGLAERARRGRRAGGAAASSASQSGPSRSGPRWPTTLVLVLARHQLDDAELEADGDLRRSVSRTTRAWCGRPPPALARRVDVPGALHLQVGVQGPLLVVVDAGEQVLAARDGLDDRPAREVGGRRWPGPGSRCARASGPRALVQAPGGAADGVALRHRQPLEARSRSPRGVATKPAASRAARSGVGAGAEELLAVGLLDGEPAQRAAAGGVGERVRRPARAASRSSGQVSSVLPPRST